MPYTYGTKIEHEFDVDHLNIWLTFRHPMDQNLKPPLALWLLEADDVSVDVVDSAWQDEFTLLLTSDTVASCPDRVLLEYNGPNSNLQTTWGKDWEPWGPILSTDIGKAPCFVDRGDPSTYDYTAASFTKDNAWHDLDLSAIVPANTKAILLAVEIVQTAVGKTFSLRKNGNTNTNNTSRLKSQVTGVALTDDVITACDEDRKIEYRADTGTWPVINVCVKGWWF